MKSFLRHVMENTTANMTYVTRDFAVDRIATDFDVEDYPEERKRMRRWEVENADGASTRRESVLAWLRAAGAMSRRSVSKSSIPKVPAWQSRER